jgi:hypothetical protein
MTAAVPLSARIQAKKSTGDKNHNVVSWTFRRIKKRM